MCIKINKQNFLNRFLALLVIIIPYVYTNNTFADSGQLDQGTGQDWIVLDDFTTNNGLPSGGHIVLAVDGGGAAVIEARFFDPFQSDAFDAAAMFWVDNTQVGGAISFPEDDGFTKGSIAEYSPVNIAGLNVQLIYDVLSSINTLRAILTMTNETGSDISVPVDYANNFGSNASTQIMDSSSGDLAFTTVDRWLITDDSDTSAIDPANTTVLYGPGSPEITTTSVSQTVFSAAGTEGTLARFNVTIPVGSSKSLMMFQQVSRTSYDAMAAASVFNTIPNEGNALVEGLSANDLAQVMNWSVDVGTDADGDGVLDPSDNCPNTTNTDQTDSDNDGQGDLCDVCPFDAANDIDGDGLCSDGDNCDTDFNPSQADTDGDNEGDACDSDIDSDGVPNEDDNCIFDMNADQSDADGDGAGNICDNDDDGDGVLDAADQCFPTPAGETVDTLGCSIDELCPCENNWKNHGAYVRCVAHASADFVNNGLITEEEKDVIMSEAGQSNCGEKNK